MEKEKILSSLEELTSNANETYKKMIKENKIKDIIKAIGLFPDQTITNDILILSQKPDATCVKRMKEWNFYHRSVNKSEKGIKVISHYLEKYEVDHTDKNGKIITKGVEKLKTDVGYVFDISQTHGEEYDYLNSNKENIARHFEAAKSALEKTARGFDVIYQDQEEKSKIDFENKKIFIKDGLSIDQVINTLIEDVADVLLKSRRQEGLENLEDFEHNAVIFAVNSKLGLDLPEYDFDMSNLNDIAIDELKGNLQKVRSVTKQMLSNFESAIERAVRELDKKIKEKETEIEEKTQKNSEIIEKIPAKSKKRTKKAQSEVENA